MNLTKTSAIVRRGINLLMVFALLYYIYTLFFAPFAYGIFIKIFPPKDLPTPIYGQLDPLEFVAKPILGNTPAYVLNTKTGKLPAQVPNKMPVYRFKMPTFSYEAGKKAKQDASYLGFQDTDLITDLKATTYKWRNPDSNGILEIVTSNRELQLDTPLAGKSLVFPPGLITPTGGLTSAKNLLSAINRLGDYSTGFQTTRMGRFLGQELIETRNTAEAQILKVDFYRYITVGTSKLPVYGPDPNKGLIQMYVAKPDIKKPYYNFPKVEAYYWEIESTTNATYPIIPIESAWEAVKLGKGVIAGIMSKDANPFAPYVPARVERILINDVGIAYYDTPKLQTYLQPIYVFSGNYTASGGASGTISIYFPAVSGEYIKQVAATSATPTTAASKK